MEVDPNPPGFDRLELEEEKTAIYLSRPNELGLKAGTLPRFLKNASQVSSFLAKENIQGGFFNWSTLKMTKYKEKFKFLNWSANCSSQKVLSVKPQ